MFDVNARQPGGQPGTIVKIGRSLVTINYRNRDRVFRLDTGRANDNYGFQWFLTADAADAARRRVEAVQRLRDHGVEVSHRCQLDLDQIEALAAALPES